jgi:ATP-dependent RNA helicase DDX1
MPELIRAVTDIGWYLPTDVQDEAIPLILGGGDVMVASETGSGKTGAFVLPLAQVVHETILKSSAQSTVKERLDLGSNLKLDPNDRDSMLQISPDLLGCNSATYKNWAGGRATFGIKGGKYYYEAVVTSAEGLCRFGWSTKAGHLELGRDSQGFGYGGTAKKSHNNEFIDYGVKFGHGDVITCMLDCDTGVITYMVNGNSQGEAFKIPEKLKGSPLFPAFAIKSSSFSINFGASLLRYNPDSSYKPMCAATSEHVVSSQSSLAFSTGKRTPRALVLEPVRDLAEQVYNSCVDITKYMTSPALRSVLLVGGDDNRKQKVINPPLLDLDRLVMALNLFFYDYSCPRLT